MTTTAKHHQYEIAMLIRCSRCRANLQQGPAFSALCIVPTCAMAGRWVSKRGNRTPPETARRIAEYREGA